MIKSFKAFISESTVHFFDMDDTLFAHGKKTPMVIVRKGDKIKRITSHEAKARKRRPGEKYDFSEFRSAKHFKRSAKPMGSVITRLQQLAQHDKVEILTGRADFDDPAHFGSVLSKHGIGETIPVHLVGNMRDSKTTAERKAAHISQAIDKYGYKNVHLYDDSVRNLAAFKALKDKYPDVGFYAHHVQNIKGSPKIRKFNK